MGSVRQARSWVLGVALVALVAKGWLAWTTIGQDDTYVLWPQFLTAVHDHGAYGIYGLEHPGVQVYNHPPLAGLWLAGINALDGLNWPTGFWIRIGSCLADFFCALVIFEVVRKRAKLWQAVAAGALVAASPVLYVISGYHGNHDAEMMFFAILAGYLLVDRKMPLLAGLSLAVSLSYKLPVLVAVPAIFIAALALGWRPFLRFTAGFTAFMAAVWLPALILYFEPYVNNVLLYKANSFPQQWGLVEFFNQTRLADNFYGTYTEHGRFILVAICGIISSYLAWKRPDQLIAAIGLAMSVFLLLSPGYAPQYHVWPLAALYAISFWFATAYNLAAGAFLIWVYTAWSHGLPWDKAQTIMFTEIQVTWVRYVWIVLLVVVLHAVWFSWRQTRMSAPTDALPGAPADGSAELPNGESSCKLPAVAPSTA